MIFVFSALFALFFFAVDRLFMWIFGFVFNF
jgi:preprotein translocase subunit SecE